MNQEQQKQLMQVDKSKMQCKAVIEGFKDCVGEQCFELTIFNESEDIIVKKITKSLKEVAEICQLFGIQVTYEH